MKKIINLLLVLSLNPLFISCNNIDESSKQDDFTIENVCSNENNICTDKLDINVNNYQLNMIYDTLEDEEYNIYPNNELGIKPGGSAYLYKEKYNTNNSFNEYQNYNLLLNYLYELIDYHNNLVNKLNVKEIKMAARSSHSTFTFKSLNPNYYDFSLAFVTHDYPSLSFMFEKGNDNKDIYFIKDNKVFDDVVIGYGDIENKMHEKIQEVIKMSKELLKNERAKIYYQSGSPEYDA